MNKDKRKKGYYTVCHPYSMTEETIGYWDGKDWYFKGDKRIKGNDWITFDDDDLQWIIEKRLNMRTDKIKK